MRPSRGITDSVVHSDRHLRVSSLKALNSSEQCMIVIWSDILEFFVPISMYADKTSPQAAKPLQRQTLSLKRGMVHGTWRPGATS